MKNSWSNQELPELAIKPGKTVLSTYSSLSVTLEFRIWEASKWLLVPAIHFIMDLFNVKISPPFFHMLFVNEIIIGYHDSPSTRDYKVFGLLNSLGDEPQSAALPGCSQMVIRKQCWGLLTVWLHRGMMTGRRKESIIHVWTKNKNKKPLKWELCHFSNSTI